MDARRVLEDVKDTVNAVGRAFFRAPERIAEEERRGWPFFSVYVRGRTAVLGDLTPEAGADTIGMLPRPSVIGSLTEVTPQASADEMVAVFSGINAAWSRRHLADTKDPERLAELLATLVDTADGAALPLFAGWQRAPRPTDPVEAVGFLIFVFREYRGGIHFAALRACGLTLTQAIALDPNARTGRLQLTGFTDEQAAELMAAVDQPELRAAYEQAWELTESAVARHLRASLTDDELAEFRDLVLALPAP
ncbi:hypothetical protein D5S17_00055 [Pseudonocardiaceae bacterium YIM PH 21723]|nr:hypothetical protein D5S17_00055 [Pseudonocardiaceae bacterium YIM PH 21723]